MVPPCQRFPHQPILALKFLSGYVHRSTLPQSRIRSTAPSEREPGTPSSGRMPFNVPPGNRNVAGDFHRPYETQKFSPPKNFRFPPGERYRVGQGTYRMGTGPKRNRKNPQGVWIVEKNFVENRGIHSGQKTAVNNLCFFTNPMWIKSPRPLRAFATFPHKFPLLPLLLPQPIYR